MALAIWNPANSTTGRRSSYAHWSEPVDRAQAIKRLELLARFLDDAIVLPGTRFSIGWDGVIGLIPGVGDALTTVLSGYLVWEARRLGVSQLTLIKMLANIGIDMLVGAVPVLGDLFDFGWKANRRNLKLLHEALARESTRAAAPSTSAHGV